MKKVLKKLLGDAVLQPIRDVRFRLQSMPYRQGDAVECPICGGKFKAFMSFRYRQNAYCPDCKSLERHRYAYLNLRDKLGFYNAPRKRVLHFAPDICLIPSIKASSYIDYVTADYMTSFTSSITVQPDHVMSIDDIKFDDNSFDVIISIGILVMVLDDAKAVREVYRTLKPGGYAVFHDPVNHNQEKSFPDSDLSHKQKQKIYNGHDQRWYYGADYADRLRAQGFVVEDDKYAQQIDGKRFGIGTKEQIYIAYKPQ